MTASARTEVGQAGAAAARARQLVDQATSQAAPAVQAAVPARPGIRTGACARAASLSSRTSER